MTFDDLLTDSQKADFLTVGVDFNARIDEMIRNARQDALRLRYDAIVTAAKTLPDADLDEIVQGIQQMIAEKKAQ